MKPISFISLMCLIPLMLLTGCSQEYMDNLNGLGTDLLILAIFSPVALGILVLCVLGAIKGTAEKTVEIAKKDYTVISDEVKQETIQEELERGD
jgi:hypothetical protein